jgi:hypothetical protein
MRVGKVRRVRLYFPWVGIDGLPHLVGWPGYIMSVSDESMRIMSTLLVLRSAEHFVAVRKKPLTMRRSYQADKKCHSGKHPLSTLLIEVAPARQQAQAFKLVRVEDRGGRTTD